jgi:hypothetical protein
MESNIDIFMGHYFSRKCYNQGESDEEKIHLKIEIINTRPRDERRRRRRRRRRRKSRDPLPLPSPSRLWMLQEYLVLTNLSALQKPTC